NLATLTTATLSTRLPAGSQIIQVMHSVDHEFVAMKLPGSDNWFVVDPWPNEPHVVAFTDCYFDPEGVKSHFKVGGTETAPEGQPFGIDMSTLNGRKSGIVRGVQRELDEGARRDGLAPTSGRMEHDWDHLSNLHDADRPVIDPQLASVKA